MRQKDLLSELKEKLPGLLNERKAPKTEMHPVLFLPEDPRIWCGMDSDHFRRAFYHHRMILKLLLKGRATTNIEGLRCLMTEGDAVLYFPHQMHSTEKETPEILYLAISFIPGLGNSSALETLRNSVFRPDPALIFRIANELTRGKLCAATYTLGHLLAECAGRAETRAPLANDLMFTEIMDYIRRNSMGSISLKTVAEEFRMSTQSLRRIFSRNMNSAPPGRILREQRLTQAKELLLRTTLNLEEIAQRCGFANPFAFSRAFKRATGVPPGRFRRENVR